MQALGFQSDERLYHAAVMPLNARDELVRAAMVGSARHGAVKAADHFGPADTGRA
jgi:hypothetical protein